MRKCIRRQRLSMVFALVASAAFLGIVSIPAVGQEESARDGSSDVNGFDYNVDVKVIKLKYADPELVERITKASLTLVGPYHIATAPEQGALILTGSSAAIATVREFVQKLDDQAQASGVAQQTLKPTPAIRLFPLQNTTAANVVEILQGAVRDETASFTADDRTNAVIAFAGDDQLEVVAELVRALDASAGASQERIQREIEPLTTVFKLQHIEIDEDLEKILQSQQKSLDATIATDAKRHLVVATGTVRKLEQLGELIRQLDVPAPAEMPPVESARQLRLLWLINDEDIEIPAPPADLKEVLAELENIGVSNLRLAAHSIVKIDESNVFRVECSGMLDGHTDLSVSGSVLPGADDRTLQLQVRATGSLPGAAGFGGGGLGGGPKTLCSIDTTVQAPDGHFVVLGVAPTGASTSAFVIQVTSARSHEAK